MAAAGSKPFEDCAAVQLANPSSDWCCLAVLVMMEIKRLRHGEACQNLWILLQVDLMKDPLRIRLQASALRPWCHFEVPISDYRSRRQAETPLDPKYQVIEFESLGTRVRNTKRFYVLNPTSDTYEFHWMPEESDKRETEDPFRCLTKRGTILPGKKYEMLFEYLPADTEIHESRWLFSVPGKQASQAFVLVGTVKEPRMGLDRPCIKFNRLLLGGKAIEKVCIVNKEHLPFSFAFDHKSYEADGPAAISLSPDSGVVGPGASFPIEVKFSPNEERFFNYNVVCNIKRKEKPLLLNIKGEGYKIHTKLVLEEADREGRVLHPGVKEARPLRLFLITCPSQELLDFGDMQVQERQSFTLKLSSPTFERDHAAAAEAADEQVAVSYDFIWQLRSATGRLMTPQAEVPPYLTITPVHGVATQDGETVITIEYSPTDAHKLDGASLRMLIPSGPDDASYTLGLAGRAYRPMLDFSTQNHDFGPCFVKRTAASAGEPSQGKTPLERLDLTVTNRGMTDCWLSTTFQRTSYLDVQSLVVPIIFTPKDYVDYRECIEFVVNDCTKYYVNLRGQGCPLQLEAASLAMQNVDFGVAVGNTGVSRSLRVVNRSVRPVEFSFQDADGKLAEKCVSWSPTMPVKLRPKEQTSFELRYKPSFPMPVFKLPLLASCNFGIDMQICHVTGSCHAAEVRLSEHSLLFGDVVFGATSTKRVHLHNFGDLGVKFRFDMPPKLLNTFSVEPSEGYAAPRDDVLLQVKFHPQRSGGSDSHPKRLRCLLDPPYQQEPIELIVQGNGMEQPEDPALQLQFSAEVRLRERKTQEVTFPPSGKNTSSEPWKVRPVINTEIPAGETFFSCPGEITVPVGGQATIPITYRPLTMTRAATEADEDTSPAKGKKKDPVPPKLGHKKHVGRLFASTPDGSAFVWTLEGVSNPPGQDKKLTAEVQCKTPHVQSIPLTNWLQQNQRFHVEINLVQPPEATEEIKLNGIGTFDVPAGQAKDYKFNVYAYREGAAVVRIVFTNPKTETSRQTVAAMLRSELVNTCIASPFAKTCAVADKDEFVGYEISFKFVAPKSIDTLRFNTVCRQVATRSISVMNPLSSVAKFKCQATHQDFRFSQNEFSVAPNSEATVDVLFRPVIVGSGEAKLSLSSPELGDFPYTVEYAAKAAGLDKTIVFKAPLGSMDSIQPFRFLHYAQKATTFTATIEAAPGQKSCSSDFAPEIKDSALLSRELGPLLFSVLLCAQEVKVDAAGAEGLEASINVRFTPSELGEIRGLLVLTSPDGGEYKALLMGYAQPPQPQGPVDVPKGKPTNVEFQNPFAEPVEFSLQVDNPSFQLTQRAVKLDSKKTVPIPVSFTGDKAQGGRLLVSAGRVSTPWVIFLQGVPEIQEALMGLFKEVKGRLQESELPRGPAVQAVVATRKVAELGGKGGGGIVKPAESTFCWHFGMQTSRILSFGFMSSGDMGSQHLVEFVNPESISETLKCPVCFEVFEDPVFCGGRPCQHVFCRTCVEQSMVAESSHSQSAQAPEETMGRTGHCPTCRARIGVEDGGQVKYLQEKPCKKALNSLLDELPVRCRRGCGWTGRRDALPSHESPGPNQCVLLRLDAAQAGGHLRDRDVRIAQLEARVAEQDRQVVDYGRQLVAKEIRIQELEGLLSQREQDLTQTPSENGVGFRDSEAAPLGNQKENPQLRKRESGASELGLTLFFIDTASRTVPTKTGGARVLGSMVCVETSKVVGEVCQGVFRSFYAVPAQCSAMWLTSCLACLAPRAAGLQPERLPGQHSYFPLDLFWPQNRRQLYAQILPYTPVELDQLLLDVSMLAAMPPWPWGHLIYQEVLEKAFSSGVPGQLAEFGVGLGGSSVFFGHLARLAGRKFLAVDSFQGLPAPDALRDNPYFVEGDFGPSDGPEENSAAFRELLASFGLENTVLVATSPFAAAQLPADFQQLAFVHIDGDLYQSVLDAFEKTWDRVSDGGIVVVDDFFHKVQGPARATADFFRSRMMAPPLLFVVPAYAVLIVKGHVSGSPLRALDGNLYSFELLRSYEPLAQAVRLSVRRAERAGGPRPGENALAFLEFLSYPADGAQSGADILRYLTPLEDMIDLSDGGALTPDGPRPARRMRIPSQRRTEHVFTGCHPLQLQLCSEIDLAVLENASLVGLEEVQVEVERLAESLNAWDATTAAHNAERLDRIAVLKRWLSQEQEPSRKAASRASSA
eukprot:s5157_g7.t2